MDSDFDSDSNSDSNSDSDSNSKSSNKSIHSESELKERFSPEDSLAELYVNKECFKDVNIVDGVTMDNLFFLYTENLVDVKLPDKITKASMCRNFKAGINPIIAKVRASKSKFCSGLASPYVRRSLHSSMMTLCIKSTSNSTIYGFLTMDIARNKKGRGDDKINIIEIDVVCANSDYSGVGTYMFQMVKKMAPILDCSRITLQSVTGALPFYLKNKFECDDDYCPMMYDLDNDDDDDNNNKPKNIIRSKPNRFRSEFRSKSRSKSKTKSKTKTKTKTNGGQRKVHKRTYRNK
jgi:hypothetical protein